LDLVCFVGVDGFWDLTSEFSGKFILPLCKFLIVMVFKNGKSKDKGNDNDKSNTGILRCAQNDDL